MLAALLGLRPGAVCGADQLFVEDFTSRAYCDTGLTTAWWDTTSGALGLHPIEAALVGAFNTPGTAYAVAVSGNHAFVADWTNGLVILDISDPTAPVHVGSCSTPGSAFGLSVAGNRAYVACSAGGLAIIDITVLAAPVVIGVFDTPGSAYSVALAGNLAYVADGSNGLVILDVSNPAIPVLEGGVDTPGNAYAVALHGNRAYVADSGSGVQTVDISTPAAVTLIGSTNTSGYAWDVAVAGDVLFLSDNSAGIVTLDITNPDKPAALGSLATPAPALGLQVDGDVLAVACENAGLLLIDMTDPSFPSIFKTVDTPDKAYDVALYGEHALVADAGSGLQVLGTRKVWSRPVSEGGVPATGDGRDLEIAGNVAWMTDDGFGLRGIDLTDPTSPIELAACALPGGVAALALAGDIAYVCGESDWVWVVDVGAPGSPAVVDSLAVPGAIGDIERSGTYLYLANAAAGVQIIDIADPQHPVVVGSYDALASVQCLAADGELLYVGTDASAQAVDISHPLAPALVSQYSDGYGFESLDPAGDIVFAVKSGMAGVLDFSDLATPTFTSHYIIHVDAFVVSGNLGALIADDHVRILDVSDPLDPEYLGGLSNSRVRNPVFSGDFIYYSGVWGFRSSWAFGSRYDRERNEARSTTVAAMDSMALAVKLTTVQTIPDGISWYVSGNGTSFTGIEAGTGYQYIPENVRGTGMTWGCVLDYEYIMGSGAPECSRLALDWLYESGVILDVEDVPEDQGRQVRLRWRQSGHDLAESPTPIRDYAIFRRVDPAAVPVGGEYLSQPGGAGDSEAFRYPPGDWEYVASVPAFGEATYTTIVPTVADSTLVDGLSWSVFMVRAATDTPTIFFDSPVDSGYSVDNLAPSPPSGIQLDNQLVITWEPVAEPDFRYVTIYGSETGMKDGGEVALGHPVGTSFDVSASPYPHYLLTATDFAGNEGAAAALVNDVSAVPTDLPSRTALVGNYPNPFNPSTTIVYDLAADAAVRLDLFDVSGRRVKRLMAGEVIAAGRNRVVWDGRGDDGRQAGSGVYFCRFETGSYSKTLRMMLVK